MNKVKRDIIVGAVFLAVGAFGGMAYASDQKVTVCHATHSAKNPYEMISVSVNALGGLDHAGDFIPAPGATNCTQTPPPIPGGGVL